MPGMRLVTAENTLNSLPQRREDARLSEAIRTARTERVLYRLHRARYGRALRRLRLEVERHGSGGSSREQVLN